MPLPFRILRLHLPTWILLASTGVAQTMHRPPAVPLITNDPFFSVWSMGDQLTDVPTKHWSGADQPLNGLVRIDGKTFRWMGGAAKLSAHHPVPAMKQLSVEVRPLHSIYHFSADGIELKVTFFTPLFPKDLDVLSRPVTYLSWEAKAEDGKAHQVDLMLDAAPQMAVNDDVEPMTWGRTHDGPLTVLSVGTQDQPILKKAGDRIRINWGYFRLVTPDGAGVAEEISGDTLEDFDATGKLQATDEADGPLPAGGSGKVAPHLAVAFALGSVGKEPVRRHVLLDYDERSSIEYLGTKLKQYWEHNGMTEAAMLTAAESEYPSLETRGNKFDSELMGDMRKVGGDDYEYLTSLVFRQTIAAHVLVADTDGKPMLFSKENASNGCIDTVDVTYPSSPFFLFFNPKLLQAQLEPLMRYASMPRWKFPFAPHDLGTYPLANGQVYGGKENNEANQMPVEESGNLILMIAALGREEGNWDFARQYMPELTKWAGYLEAKGMNPENQLSTDDFAGHLAHNTNLSIKAIEALGAFVQIARGVGDTKLAAHYENVVQPMPAKWQEMALDHDHYKLAFDQSGTWSQKYNLVWDRVLELHLFPDSVAATEWAYYEKQMQKYGLPLDNRKMFTKLDWQVWTASLANPKDSADLLHRISVWLDSSKSRVPTTDWYGTVTGLQVGFQARSVVGGVYIKALLDPAVAARWKSKN
jgi:hypothetical protein